MVISFNSTNIYGELFARNVLGTWKDQQTKQTEFTVSLEGMGWGLGKGGVGVVIVLKVVVELKRWAKAFQADGRARQRP